MGGGRKSRGESETTKMRERHAAWSFETRESPERRSLERRTSARGTERGGAGGGGEKEKDRALCLLVWGARSEGRKMENTPARRSKKREREMGCCRRAETRVDGRHTTTAAPYPPPRCLLTLCASLSRGVSFIHGGPQFAIGPSSLSLFLCLPPATA